ncbi:hypothetical protein [methane-oxidizing endosymbiont of Gigantopelta aegis]|uniref:hypothetical protein n=1 Tax=methane-oxidizing endosymbiont of Gigantopelta aegis TaxID=2794938 RepID=UPI00315A7835
MLEVLPPERECVIARELTKLHETIVRGPLSNICEQVNNDPNMRKGEFVVIVAGAEAVDEESEQSQQDDEALLAILLSECSVKTAASLAAKITGHRKKIFIS